LSSCVEDIYQLQLLVTIDGDGNDGWL